MSSVITNTIITTIVIIIITNSTKCTDNTIVQKKPQQHFTQLQLSNELDVILRHCCLLVINSRDAVARKGLSDYCTL